MRIPDYLRTSLTGDSREVFCRILSCTDDYQVLGEVCAALTSITQGPDLAHELSLEQVVALIGLSTFTRATGEEMDTFGISPEAYICNRPARIFSEEDNVQLVFIEGTTIIIEFCNGDLQVTSLDVTTRPGTFIDSFAPQPRNSR